MTQLRLPWSEALVVGLGASGRAAVDLLLALGLSVRGYDARAEVEELLPEAMSFCTGDTIPDRALIGVDLIVLSPGVPPAQARERAARLAPRAEIHGELSLGLDLLLRHTGASKWPGLCLVTGTNGKSTVTALTAHLLESSGFSVFAGGNLGIASCTLVHQHLFEGRELPERLVLECSSYQLETLHAVQTDVAVLCNISPDHLARYDSMEHYASTKTKIFAGLGDEGLALLDAEDAWTARLRPTTGRVELVMEPDLDFDGRWLRVADALFDRQSLRAAGRHNAKNALFAVRAALELGASTAACAKGLQSFEGLPHRMAFVREHEGIAYYDDSKATNVASVLAGLRGFERPFVLIAGGQLKGEDLSPLIELVASEGIALVAIGQDRAQLAAAANGRLPCTCFESLDEGFAHARSLAGPGDAVVLSPAGASWDQYASFMARGEHFAALAEAL